MCILFYNLGSTHQNKTCLAGTNITNNNYVKICELGNEFFSEHFI